MKYIIAIFSLLYFTSCGSVLIGWHKKYKYYPDYSDQEKLTYYRNNKAIIDSLVSLTSTACLIDYMKLKSETGSDYWQRSSPGFVDSSFFATSPTAQNVFWLEFKKRYPEHQQELGSVINKMINLKNSLSPSPETRSIQFFNSIIYIPLKRIKVDTEAGGDYYSFIMVFDTSKTIIDSVKRKYAVYPNLRSLDYNLLTNEREKNK